MKISNEDKKQLRRLGHNLNPVVTIASKGLSENVLAEINRALNDHELIKIKLSSCDNKSKSEIVRVICEQSAAQVVQSVGHIVLLLKKSEQPNAKLSNLLR